VVAPPFLHDNTKESRSIEDKGSNYSSIDNEVFLYYTEKDPSLRNRVYKYQWNGNRKQMMYRNADAELINPKSILDLPAGRGPYHKGGKLKISHDDKFLYTVIGALNSPNSKLRITNMASNHTTHQLY
jgi:glucose/arabinose dehydrogenase